MVTGEDSNAITFRLGRDGTQTIGLSFCAKSGDAAAAIEGELRVQTELTIEDVRDKAASQQLSVYACVCSNHEAMSYQVNQILIR